MSKLRALTESQLIGEDMLGIEFLDRCAGSGGGMSVE
jgi:hypothetical protein